MLEFLLTAEDAVVVELVIVHQVFNAVGRPDPSILGDRCVLCGWMNYSELTAATPRAIW